MAVYRPLNKNVFMPLHINSKIYHIIIIPNVLIPTRPQIIFLNYLQQNNYWKKTFWNILGIFKIVVKFRFNYYKSYTHRLR